MTSATGSNDLARLLAAARGDLPMREVARRSGLSAAQISRIESGSVGSPTIETLTRLARALGRDPQLLLVAVDRIMGEEAVGLVRAALNQLGASAPARLREAAERVEAAHRRVRELDKHRVALLNEWEMLAGQRDVLAAESAELEEEIEGYQSSEDLNDDPEAVADLRDRAKECETRLDGVLRDLYAIEKQADGLYRQLRNREAAMLKQAEHRSKAVRRCAGELFVHGAASTSHAIEALLDDVVRMPPGFGKSHVLSHYLGSLVLDDEFKRTLAEVAGSSAEIQVATEHLREQLGETLEKSFAQTRAELEQLTRTIRNQLVHQPGDADFRRLAAAWNRLTPERREKVLDFVEDQRRLSLQERLDREGVTAIEEAPSKSRS